MSGGSLDYFSYQMENHVGDFNDKELDELMKDLAKLHHDREWFLSGDTGEGDWNEARDKFKKKWFTDTGRQERIETYLAEIGGEVRLSFGFADYCRDCKHYTAKHGSKYGNCAHDTRCLRHPCECACDAYERR